jgi:hypothetical protein
LIINSANVVWAAGQLKELTYADLVPWLMRCRTHCRADRVSAFLDDFAAFIQKQFLGVTLPPSFIQWRVESGGCPGRVA